MSWTWTTFPIWKEQEAWAKNGFFAAKHAAGDANANKENVKDNDLNRVGVEIPAFLGGVTEGNYALQEMSARQVRTLQAVRDLEKDTQNARKYLMAEQIRDRGYSAVNTQQPYVPPIPNDSLKFAKERMPHAVEGMANAFSFDSSASAIMAPNDSAMYPNEFSSYLPNNVSSNVIVVI